MPHPLPDDPAGGPRPSRRLALGAGVGLCLGALAGLGPAAAAGTVTVQNCGRPVSFPDPARRAFVNDGNMISMALALRATPQVAAVSAISDSKKVLIRNYGAAAVNSLHVASASYPSLEAVLAQRPDVMVAGWDYGYDPSKNLTPATLTRNGIAAYTLTESCLRGTAGRRGLEAPWNAVRTDLTNLGRIFGRQARATAVVANLDRRLTALRTAPKPPRAPTVFLFDSGTSAPLTSGRYGAPQGIISAAGGRNLFAGDADSWHDVSWEAVVKGQPDAIAINDYSGQSVAQKIAILRAQPGVKDSPAVRHNRFIALPYVEWTSGPLNIDAAERLHAALARWGLVPRTGAEAPR